MSLEKAIEENTKAIYNLIVALGVKTFVPEAIPEVIPKVIPKEGAPKKEGKAPEGKGEPEHKVAYLDAKDLVLDLAASHRDEIKKIFTHYKLSKLSDLLDQNGDVADQEVLNSVHKALKELNHGTE